MGKSIKHLGMYVGLSLAWELLLIEEILHQLRWSISHYLQGFIHVRWCRIYSINSSISPSNKLLMVFRFSRLGEISDLFFVERAGRIFVTGDAWKEKIRILFPPNVVFFHGSMKSNGLTKWIKMVIYQVRRNQKYSTRMGRIVSSSSDSFSQNKNGVITISNCGHWTRSWGNIPKVHMFQFGWRFLGRIAEHDLEQHDT